MTIYCTHCAEPWELDGLYPHEVEAILGGCCDYCGGDPARDIRHGGDIGAQARAMLTRELAGMDPDGLAGELADLDALGVFS